MSCIALGLHSPARRMGSADRESRRLCSLAAAFVLQKVQSLPSEISALLGTVCAGQGVNALILLFRVPRRGPVPERLVPFPRPTLAAAH